MFQDKTLAQAMAELKGHDCKTCKDTTCRTHSEYVEPTEEEVADDIEKGRKMATEKMVKLTVEYVNEQGETEVNVHEGFCATGMILIEDDLEGGFSAMNFSTGAFSIDRLEATLEGLKSLTKLVQSRKMEAMISKMLNK